MGLMQVMPGTYAELRARHNLGPDPFDPHDNIMAGVGYMREMYDMYGSPGFLAAYNAGPNRLDDYLANQRSLPDETRRYVAVIGPALRYAAPRVHSPAEQFAMNQLPVNIPSGPRYGYGSVQVPTVQLASASTAYTQPVFTRAAVQPTYTPPVQQPRAVAWAQPAQPVYTPAPVPQPRALAWAEPPRPVYAPAPTYAPPPQRTVVARNEDRDEDETPLRRIRAFVHRGGSTRVALAIPPVAPQRRGGSLHLISSAMAAEVYTTRRGRKTILVPASYTKPEHARGRAAPAWRLHATGPVQSAHGCHKTHGKTVCI
jgi:Transglycosylase SLT domain